MNINGKRKRENNRTIKRILSSLMLFIGCISALQAQNPNVVFILADDLGWSDTELYGTSHYYKTPNINRLAERGVLFTQAYTSSPVCSPTRCSIMAGQLPSRTGIVHARCHLPQVSIEPSLRKSAPSDNKALDVLYSTRLDTSQITLAEILKNNGYVTGHFGKWHLGLAPYDAKHQGFDVAVPLKPEGAIENGYLAPWPELEEEGFIGKPGEHIEDRMAQEAVKFMRKNKDKPFFLNYWAFSIHSPWSAKPELAEKYAESVDPLSPQRNPVYAAMIESFDDAVGTIIDEIDRLGISDKTIIIFYSDNGGNTFPPTKTEPVGYEHIPGTNSYPFRAGKGSFYEGGTRVPAIFVWPGKSKANTVNHSVFSSVDLYPTLLDMLGIQPNPDQILDGKSVANAINGEQIEHTIFGYRPIYDFSVIPAAWVRKNDWKLIRFFCDNEDQSDRLELYNLNWDVAETKNISNRFPDKVSELNQLIDSFLVATDAVIPIPNPDYKN